MSQKLVSLFDMILNFCSAEFWDFPVYFLLAYCCFSFVFYFIGGGKH